MVLDAAIPIGPPELIGNFLPMVTEKDPKIRNHHRELSYCLASQDPFQFLFTGHD
jgi:hypothetical protein